VESTVGSIDAIAEAAGIPTQVIGGTMVIHADYAKALVDAVESTGRRILGIEGFSIDGSILTPEMDLIADFSAILDPRRSAQETRRFLRGNRPADVYFEIVLDSDVTA
jgi:hypothetical protein